MTAAGAEYGGALYELAAEEGLEEVILEQLTEVRRLLAENPDYEKLLAMPSVPKAERCAALDEAFGGQAEPYLVNFLKLLCEKGAIRTLPDCLKEYRARYNEAHGIVPKTIVKEIRDSIEISDKAENAKLNTRRMGKMEREAAIERLTREMKEAAKLLEFEHAAFLRDQIDRLRRGENPTSDSQAETERRANHAQTQRRGRKYGGKR